MDGDDPGRRQSRFSPHPNPNDPETPRPSTRSSPNIRNWVMGDPVRRRRAVPDHRRRSATCSPAGTRPRSRRPRAASRTGFIGFGPGDPGRPHPAGHPAELAEADMGGWADRQAHRRKSPAGFAGIVVGAPARPCGDLFGVHRIPNPRTSPPCLRSKHSPSTSLEVVKRPCTCWRFLYMGCHGDGPRQRSSPGTGSANWSPRLGHRPDRGQTSRSPICSTIINLSNAPDHPPLTGQSLSSSRLRPKQIQGVVLGRDARTGTAAHRRLLSARDHRACSSRSLVGILEVQWLMRIGPG